MSNAAMPLSDQDLEQIKHHLTDWMDSKLLQSQWVPGPELLERSVRVEEELKHQRLLMRESFEQFEKRFELIEKRFEQVDKRFEQVDKRFEQVDKRFEPVDKRFEQVDKRLELQQQEIRLIARKQDHILWSIVAGMAGLFTSQFVLFA
ncbi:MAG: hypothetical protein VYE01_04385 [Pseudomonadota bacterium]|nr:hypothetical protein [Pseudomonadota bacterium]MEC9154599.1 hypothetical protein [Pseudomonadota bacterium]MED5347177.1 hypothetical protein [Pseudomonadota bacterium]MEE2824128.1 hypothetical protein [Pseudomonadota bacterium]MEE3173448.1 hypothetical protein [Pseudomonadota bacterium]